MDNLRENAERILRDNQNQNFDLSKIELQKLIEELQIHQIELQIQNEELQESRIEIEKAKSKYFNLFDLAPVGYMIIDEKGIIAELNIKAAEILGRRKSFIEFRPFISVLEAPSMNVFFEHFEYVRKNQINESIEVSIIKKQTKRYLEVTITKYLDNNYLLILTDITDRKTVEIKLKENEQKYRSLFENATDAVFVADATSGIIFDANKKATLLTGKNLEDIIGSHQTELHPAESADNTRKAFVENIKKNRETMFTEFSVQHSSGDIIPVEISASLVEIEDKAYIYGIFRDITDRKKAEQQVLDAKNLAFKILDNFPALIWQADINKSCFFFNKTWLNFTGRTLQQEMGNGWAENVHPDDLQNCMNTFIEAFEKREAFEMQYRLLNFKGEYRWITDIGNPFYDLDNSFIGYIGSCYDISDQINSKEILENLNSTKDKLFSIIAHDLRSPFNAILGFSELLSNNLQVYEPEKSKKYLEIINNTANSTLKLLNNLLTWAKTQTGQLNFAPEIINISNMINEIISDMSSKAALKNLKLNYFQSADIEVFADPNILPVIFRNLISNAIKYTNHGGEINVFSIKKGKIVEITVSDNGVGMPPEVLNALFVANQTITTQGTQGEKGSGLGLLLCKELVEIHGGKICASSKTGEGSEFVFTIPAHN